MELGVYTVLGISDEQTSCDCCGRQDLKATVVLEGPDGEVVRFGRDCAARVTATSPKAVASAVRTAERTAAEERARRAAVAAAAADRQWQAWLDEHAGPGERGEQIDRLGGFGAARARFRSGAELSM